jgi:Mg-chelatase subunit ChlD
MAEDPFRINREFMGRPLKAPDREKQDERIDRLAGDASRGITPDQPESALTKVDKLDEQTELLRVSPENLVPRLDISDLAVNILNEDKIQTEKPLTVSQVTPLLTQKEISSGVFDFTAPSIASQLSAGSAGLAVTPFGNDDIGFSSLPPPPMPTMPQADGEGSSGFGEDAGFASLAAVAMSDDAFSGGAKGFKRSRGGGDIPQKVVPEINLPKADLPPPSMPKVDEGTVSKRKEAVRRLRDETSQNAESFEPFVNLALQSWIDPLHPQFKYFRVRVSSRDDRTLPVIPKDIVFLMDASGSIAQDRLRSCCSAVMNAIRNLNPNDRFNIVRFASHFSYAFPERSWQNVNETSILKAEKWLGKLKAKGTTDVFGTLTSILSLPRDPARPMIAVVVTDGDATKGVTSSAEIISRFSELNGGLISVYMYGVKSKSNAYLMDMIARGNRGGWTRSDALMRIFSGDALPQFVNSFNRPLLTDISVIFSNASNVEAYPKLVSNLYSSQPIDIYGICPANQKSVVFSMRGLNARKVYEHIFELPFSDAEKGDASLKDNWAQRRVYALISSYTARPSPSLKREILMFSKAYKVEVPYKEEMK